MSYVCNYCGHETTSLLDMKMHQKKHFNEEVQLAKRCHEKYERCEMCGKKKRDVHQGQCTRCHAQTCDEPFEECPAKQHLWQKADFWERFFLDGLEGS